MGFSACLSPKNYCHQPEIIKQLKRLRISLFNMLKTLSAGYVKVNKK